MEELVYGFWPPVAVRELKPLPDPLLLVVLPRSVASEQAALWRAMDARTWGDLRANAPAETYLEILGQAGFGDLEDFTKHLEVGRPMPGAMNEALRDFASKQGDEVPDDDEPFDVEKLPSYCDGDFPPSPFLLMHDLLPEDVVALGELRDTTFNGTFVEFQAEEAEAILGLLRAEGYSCVEDQELIESQPFRD